MEGRSPRTSRWQDEPPWLSCRGGPPCFDVWDRGTKEAGERIRCWDSCILSVFTREGSDDNPRGLHSQRNRRRIEHKLLWQGHGHVGLACVGCGRCEGDATAFDGYALAPLEQAAIRSGDIGWIESFVTKLEGKQKVWIDARLSQEHWGFAPAAAARPTSRPPRAPRTSPFTSSCAASSSSPSIAPDAPSAQEPAAALVRITHPFHPLLGRQFVRVAERCSRHGDRVWYEAADGSVATNPRARTDLAAPCLLNTSDAADDLSTV